MHVRRAQNACISQRIESVCAHRHVCVHKRERSQFIPPNGNLFACACVCTSERIYFIFDNIKTILSLVLSHAHREQRRNALKQNYLILGAKRKEKKKLFGVHSKIIMRNGKEIHLTLFIYLLASDANHCSLVNIANSQTIAYQLLYVSASQTASSFVTLKNVIN